MFQGTLNGKDGLQDVCSEAERQHFKSAAIGHFVALLDVETQQQIWTSLLLAQCATKCP